MQCWSLQRIKANQVFGKQTPICHPPDQQHHAAIGVDRLLAKASFGKAWNPSGCALSDLNTELIHRGIEILVDDLDRVQWCTAVTPAPDEEDRISIACDGSMAATGIE